MKNNKERIKPLVSIIVPIYNGEKKIVRCVESLINQTLKDIEILLINDGSTDNSLEIIKNLQSKNDRIRVIDKENSGVSETRNLGIIESKGEFLGFVDIDDYVDECMYEKLYLEAISNKSDMVICRYAKDVNGSINEEKFYGIEPTEDIKSFFVLNMIGAKDEKQFNQELYIMGSVWRAIYLRKNIINNNIMFDNNLSYAEDLIFNLKYISISQKISIVDEVLYFYDMSLNQLSRGYRSNLIDTIKEILIYIENLEFNSSSNLKIYERMNYAYFRYFITAFRNAINGSSILNNNDRKYVKKIVKDAEIKRRIKNIKFNKLSGKNKYLYLMFRYNSYSLALILWIVKSIIKKYD